MSISRTPELPIEHNDWVVSTTASNHFAHDRYSFTDDKFTAFRSSIVSSSGRVLIVGIGTVDLEVYAISPNYWAVNYPTKGKRPDTVFLSLKNVLHIPSANVNVFSTHAINQSGYDVVLDGRERGGYLQEYHDFMLEHKAYASIGMNGKHYLLKTIALEELVSATQGFPQPHKPQLPIPQNALLSFDWSDEEEQKWMQLVKEKGEFDGEYIDRIMEVDEKYPHGRNLEYELKRHERRQRRKQYALGRVGKRKYEDEEEELLQAVQDDLVLDDLRLTGFDFRGNST